jgi:hypothetical protein
MRETPYLDHGDDDLKMTQIKGEVQNAKMSRGEEDGPELAQKGPGPAGSFGPAQGVLGPVRPAL